MTTTDQREKAVNANSERFRNTRRSSTNFMLLAMCMLLVFSIAACAKNSSEESTDTTETTLGPPQTSSTATTAVRMPCNETNLSADAQAKYPGSQLNDLACSSAIAMATITGGGSPADPGVAFFQNGDDGKWTLTVVSAIDALDANKPEGTPVVLVNAWRQKYQSRTTQQTQQTPPPTEAPTTTAPPQECPPDVAPEFCDLFVDEPPPTTDPGIM